MNPVTRPRPELVSIDELDQAIVNLAARINAETYELLVLIRQFDERAGWLRWGLGNCAEWLHYRCDLSMNAAREKVRVAHALKTLPDIATAFATGELSYSKVRAMTRVVIVFNANDKSSSSLPAPTTRVIARTFEYDSSPVAKAVAISGSALSACATRTFSLAAFMLKSQR